MRHKATDVINMSIDVNKSGSSTLAPLHILHKLIIEKKKKATLSRPKLDDRHFGLVHTVVSYTLSELTTLVV